MGFRCAQCGGYKPIGSDRKTYDSRLTNLHGRKCDQCMNWFPSGTLVRESRNSIHWWEREHTCPGTLENDIDDGTGGLFD